MGEKKNPSCGKRDAYLGQGWGLQMLLMLRFFYIETASYTNFLNFNDFFFLNNVPDVKFQLSQFVS